MKGVSDSGSGLAVGRIVLRVWFAFLGVGDSAGVGPGFVGSTALDSGESEGSAAGVSARQEMTIKTKNTHNRHIVINYSSAGSLPGSA